MKKVLFGPFVVVLVACDGVSTSIDFGEVVETVSSRRSYVLSVVTSPGGTDWKIGLALAVDSVPPRPEGVYVFSVGCH